MKDFRKNKEGLFICEECGRTFKSYQGLRTHIYHSHKNLSKKEYFDKWIKEPNEEICKICSNLVQFISLKYGYKNTCSKKCSNIFGYKQRKKALLKIYGVENQFQRKKIKDKIKNTNRKKYGVDYPRQSKEIQKRAKQTCLERYKDENYNVKKFKQTCLNKYGVEHPNQIEENFNKGFGNRIKIKKFKNTLYYQGSYELDFLEKYYNKYLDIERGPRIKYVFEGKEHYYFSDFLIPSKNLIVEIKNSYLAKRDKEKINAKKKATINKGFNYIMIVDKNYNKLTTERYS